MSREQSVGQADQHRAGSARFDPGAYGAFRIAGHSFDPETRTVVLHYALDDVHHFDETVVFETVPSGPTYHGEPGFERALLNLKVAAGVSYYKAAAPPQILVEGAGLTTEEHDLHLHLYDDGLREFAVANGLVVPRPVQIHATGPVMAPARPPRTGNTSDHRLVVPIGGGKDSMVLIEAVRHLDDLRPRLFAVNPHPLVRRLAEQSGLELITVRRTLSPHLAEVNGSGALNGHVPITAVISLIAVAGSFLYDYDIIAMAVERSASEETIEIEGAPVNHQYSKSLGFERLLTGLIASSIDPELTYGSALRPYSELAIGRAFAGLTAFHGTFCSCNRAFRQSAAPDDRWCGDCPKCRFVALMLAPYLDADSLAGIFAHDLFDDIRQVAGFSALMSDEEKPFECVGERREAAVAVRLLTDLPQWRDKPVVRELSETARGLVDEEDVRRLLVADEALSFPCASVARAVRRLLEPGT
ncbi:MAG: endonuclease domain-containing protein [Acidimicrobiales bacterium]